VSVKAVPDRGEPMWKVYSDTSHSLDEKGLITEEGVIIATRGYNWNKLPNMRE
jgi:5-deoxy-D-glucuronate isomerase